MAAAEITFDRPADGYNPQKTTINLFLYDIRESTELRSNESVVERQHGIVSLRRPPLRVACSYLVTAWTESGVPGEEAILKEHQLLAEVLRVFAGMPTLPHSNNPNDPLASQPYPIPLVTLQSELMRNPAEFWSALGGKLRPSFTVTATIAIEQAASPVTAFEVSTKKIVIRETELQIEETLFQLGGTVRSASTQTVIPDALLTLLELGSQVRSDAEGRFSLSVPSADEWTLTASKPGFSNFTVAVEVPGNSPTAFDIEMTELT
jgi:hypothetical protein